MRMNYGMRLRIRPASSLLFGAILTAGVAMSAMVGCSGKDSADSPSNSETEAGSASDGAGEEGDGASVLEQQKALAADARTALFQSLLGELTTAMQEDGPAGAIDVCKTSAPALAQKVGTEKGVRIGRTSLQLRNAANQPPDWARDFVDSRKGEEVSVELENGALGVLTPIRLMPPCEVCHGAKESLMPEVQTALADHYPNDEATGYVAGDLRGYFWVEVPRP